MARPRTVNPTGDTRRLALVVAEPVARQLEREAKRRGISLSQVIRERIEKASA